MFQDGSMPGSVNVLEQGAGQARGEHARMSTIIGALAIADVVKTSLGPKGMDKILQPGPGSTSKLSVTNDGATILKSILVDNPAAKVLIDISKTQDEEVGDGTTSVCVLAGELLRQAEKLMEQQLHPQLIVAGFRKAADVARAKLESMSLDHSADPVKFRSDLLRIAETTLSSKVLSQDKHHFAEMAVDAVMKLKGSTHLEQIQLIKKAGGTLRDSYLDPDGYLLDKKMAADGPKRMVNAKILLANTPMDQDKIKLYGTKVKTDSMAKVAEIEAAERAKMNAKVDKIIAHGCNVFINRQLVYNLPEQRLVDAGIMVIEHADFDGIAQLAHVTRGDIVSTFDTPELVTLGHALTIEEIMIGEDKLIRFGGCPNAEACSIVLRGANEHILDEAERSLHDALCVLSQTVVHTKVLPGGGACEMSMANAIEEAALSVPGKQALAMEAFARGLRGLPEIIATNGGHDAADLIAKLRVKHHAGDMEKGDLADMYELGIMESFKVKLHVLLSAAEAAEMLLRVDNIVQCAPRQRDH
ncbi:t-complex protein 1 subunit beta [Pavlovales sp. CCMP2436]|nr:t-complex protein 1 subunit beta [Pavlovales sp. CCMP2436]